MNLLKAKIKEITKAGLPIMEGKEKLDIDINCLNQVLTVENYGYMEGTNDKTGEVEEYVVITLKEYPHNFIYGSAVVTGAFKKLDTILTDEDREETLKDGLTFKLTKQMSKNKRKYTKIDFYPEV